MGATSIAPDKRELSDSGVRSSIRAIERMELWLVVCAWDGGEKHTSGLSGKRVNPWCATDGLMRYNNLNYVQLSQWRVVYILRTHADRFSARGATKEDPVI